MVDWRLILPLRFRRPKIPSLLCSCFPNAFLMLSKAPGFRGFCFGTDILDSSKRHRGHREDDPRKKDSRRKTRNRESRGLPGFVFWNSVLLRDLCVSVVSQNCYHPRNGMSCNSNFSPSTPPSSIHLHPQLLTLPTWICWSSSTSKLAK